ncbi:hypothetical protein TRFO_39111 [Tritrichomonas foetus]|uniref:Uncharacterized protein n=1 Tax=Tritrichomonas foetus TaxID=1144522 RepID=A0A1J4JAM1_9EUKA|nr:hypothetical protein TRFO_39111 [Tritrichomonas foetus]|eukprot:OHS94707.1 hypothetical protein TRFO_39111 [Tritrichomonas foetus]
MNININNNQNNNGNNEDGDAVSILNFEEKYGDDEVPVFTEEATIKAMNRLVIEPEMLRKPTDADYAEFKDFPDVKKQVESVLNARRRDLIDQIISEREKILTRSRNYGESSSERVDFVDNTARIKKETMARIERIQKKEIEQLIVSELLREKAQRKDQEDRAKKEERQKQYEQEVKKKQADDAEKKRKKDEMLLQRIAEKEAELLEAKKKQEADIIRNQELLAQRKAEKMKQLAEADKQRQMKAQKQREMLDQQRKEEQKAIEERLKEQEKRELKNLQLRELALKQLKENNLIKFNKQQQRYALSQRQERENMERRRKQMEQKEKESQERMDIFLKNREKQVKRQQARSQMLVERHKSAAAEISRQRDERIRAMVFKDNKDQERRDAILTQRLEKIKKERIELLEKQNKIKEMNDKEKEDLARKREEAEKRWNEEKEKSDKAKFMHEEEIRKKAALQKLRDKIQNENVERQRRMKEMDQQEKGAVSQERQMKATLYVSTKQELAMKKREAMTQLDFKKSDILTTFRNEMKKGGKIDIDNLAKTYGVDIEQLRKKVEESDIR